METWQDKAIRWRPPPSPIGQRRKGWKGQDDHHDHGDDDCHGDYSDHDEHGHRAAEHHIGQSGDSHNNYDDDRDHDNHGLAGQIHNCSPKSKCDDRIGPKHLPVDKPGIEIVNFQGGDKTKAK